MPKQATKKPGRQGSEPAESIAESKLSRVEMIAREALDILGEEAPDDLRRSVAEVKAQHEAEMAALTDKLTQAGSQIDDLTAQVKSAERLAEERFAEAEEVWALARTHAADLAATAQQLDEAKEEIDLLRVTADSRARELDELRGQHAALTAELASTSAKASDLGDAVKAETERRESAEAELESARSRIESLASAMDAAAREAHTRIETLERELDEARQQAETQTERAESLTVDLAEVRALAEELEQANDERVERIESLTADLASTRDELADRGNRLADAEQRSQRARETLAEVQTRLAEITDEREALSERLSQRSTETAKVRRELAELTQRLADRDRQIADLTDAPASPAANTGSEPAAEIDESELDEIRTELEARETELAYAREQLDRADGRADRYRDRAEAAERSLEKAAAIVRRARRRSSERSEQFGALVTRLTATRIRCENLEAACEAQAARLKRLTIIAAACGAAALVTLTGALIF